MVGMFKLANIVLKAVIISPYNKTLHEKHTAETRLHEEWRHADLASPSSRLALLNHPRCTPGRVSD
jgi:hypothetical protein